VRKIGDLESRYQFREKQLDKILNDLPTRRRKEVSFKPVDIECIEFDLGALSPLEMGSD